MYIIAGNGGLMAEAEHFAAELTGVFHKEYGVACIALGSNNAELTALVNDIGWEDTYARLVDIFGNEGDTFIGMTTSRSENILKACDVAFEKGMSVILLDKDSLFGDTTAEKQEYAVKYLHQLAREIKDAYEDSSNR